MNKHLIVIGVVILLLAVGFSGCVRQSGTGLPPKERFYGTWLNSNENVTITFFSNNTFILIKGNETVENTWAYNTKQIPYLAFQWENGEDRYAPLFFDNDNLRLVGQSGEFKYFAVIDLLRTSD